MKKILIIAYYDLKEFLDCIKFEFEYFNFAVIHYPLFKYAYDTNDKIVNYAEHLNNYIKQNKPDVILWWFIDVPVDIFKIIKNDNANIIFIIFNVDDPINLNKELYDKAKYFDIIVTPCNDSMHKYKLYSQSKIVLFGPFGFDDNVFFPIKNTEDYSEEKIKYETDISILCYNLFLDDEVYAYQYVNKIKLINDVILYAKKNGKKFKIYGTPIIKELFPDNYGGNINYHEINLLYNFSKINITLHAFCDKSLSINEHVMPILGSGALLLIDNIKNLDKILINNKDCVYLDKNNYIDQIDKILNTYSEYENIKQNGYMISQNYVWKKWVKNIINYIGLIDFNADLYKKIYKLNMSDDELKKYWSTIGIEQKHVCYNFVVPDNFDHTNYANDYNLKETDSKILYHHWYFNNKNDMYLKSKNNNNEMFNNIKSYNVTHEEYINILNTINNIKNNNYKDEYLMHLQRQCKSENLKINEIIDSYINLIM